LDASVFSLIGYQKFRGLQIENPSGARSTIPTKKKKHTCLLCGALSRNVTYYALMGGYYHYECWLELGRDNVMMAVIRRRSDNPVPAPANVLEGEQGDLFE